MFSSRAADFERGLARIRAIRAQGDPAARNGHDVRKQRRHFGGLCAVVERRDQFHRLTDALQIGLQLRFEIGVEHGGGPEFLRGLAARTWGPPGGAGETPPGAFAQTAGGTAVARGLVG